MQMPDSAKGKLLEADALEREARRCFQQAFELRKAADLDLGARDVVLAAADAILYDAGIHGDDPRFGDLKHRILHLVDTGKPVQPGPIQ